MLDINFIRENKEKVQAAIDNKKQKAGMSVAEIVQLDDLRLDLLRRVETKRALRNQLSSNISKLGGEDREKMIKEATQVKEDLVDLEKEFAEAEGKLNEQLLLIPNVYHESVPVGESDEENVVARKWGTPKKFDFDVKDHVDLGETLDLIDIDTSAKVSGSRFNYLKNEAVLLQFGLVQFVLKTLTNKKVIGKLAKEVGNPSDNTFIPILPPVIMSAEVMKKMDRLDPIDERYYLPEDNQVFVGSAEHTMGPMFMDEILEQKKLPLRFIGYSTAFRREAGSYGQDTKGILRRHQFDKLEMESFTTPEMGMVEQDLFVAIQEYLVQQLEIPYQVISICTGDMGKPDFRQIDVECWMPGQDKYRETHTSDYMTDFQSRRLNTRYKKDDGSLEFVHMNDATAFAIGRVLIALIENNQQRDGSVLVPKVLQNFVGKKKIEPK